MARPHDHNRDWSDTPHWPAVAAAMKHVMQLDREGRLELFIDLHNPGPSDLEPFFFTAPRDEMTSAGLGNLDRFLTAAREAITGPMPLGSRITESGGKYDPAWQRISNTWVDANTAEHVVAVCLETPWNTPHSTTEGYRTVGRQLGQAVARYIQWRDAREGASNGSKSAQ